MNVPENIRQSEQYQKYVPEEVKEMHPLIQLLLAIVMTLGTIWLIQIIFRFLFGGKSENFSDVDNTFILYYVDWCPHCRDFKPIWEKLTNLVNNNPSLNVTLVKINCQEQPELCQRDGVSGYPTLKLKKGNGDVIEYNSGDRSMGSLIQFLKNNL